ncbi:Phospho-N-acetylmuramoyl-pentapeptide-transferase [Geodia barretti]|uniref:Phospho-N-acetylmuramoyl-pentapeptide-transferase n=1 Tax=Geodia barretti TaxID=519541 RepID=A0AA35SPC6_GEOBA|nr:Phospho-N-acetylmuramoyl-pentapeptide-transferase [Geodia barretti]
MINRLKQLRIGEHIREEGPKDYQSKAGTPTMGGVLIIISVLISVVFWSRLDQPYIYLMILTTLWFGGLGFLDDYSKLVKQQSLGLRGWHKIGLQTVGALVIASYLYKDLTTRTSLILPFFKEVQPNLGILFIPFATLVIVGASNAVNLTDGMDGLAIGCTLFVAAAYLNIFHLPVGGEVTTVFCAALVGAGLGFLWYNGHPAQVFMGDTGSLALGATLGTVAVLIKQEFLLVIVGAIFVVETLSVIIQVWSFRTFGKRVFKMSPIHYHFLLSGWKESKVVIRFWIVGLILVLIALSTLKLR